MTAKSSRKGRGKGGSNTEELEPSKNQRLRRFCVKCEVLAGELCLLFNPAYGRVLVMVHSGISSGAKVAATSFCSFVINFALAISASFKVFSSSACNSWANKSS